MTEKVPTSESVVIPIAAGKATQRILTEGMAEERGVMEVDLKNELMKWQLEEKLHSHNKTDQIHIVTNDGYSVLV